MSVAPLMALFCRILIDKFSNLPKTLPWAEPVLVYFLEILNNSDLLEALKALWFMKTKKLKSSELSNLNLLKEEFSKAVLQLSPMLHLSEGQWMDPEKKLLLIQKCIQDPIEVQSRAFEGLFYQPFTTAETCFDP
jgi:hypothetical protein